MITTKYTNEIYIAPWENTKWLVISSLFWIGPSILAYVNNLYYYAMLLLVTSIISANYWRKATYSWRRNLDLFSAKIAFTVFTSNGIYYIRSPTYIITGYTGLILLVYCYYLSDKLWRIKNNNWYKYHFLFHLIMTYEEIIIIDSIIKYHTIT